MSDAYKVLKERDSHLKIDNDLVEIQKTIIYFGNSILQKLTDIQDKLEKDKSKKEIKQETKDPIFEHLLQIKIPPGYRGNDLKW